jgi:hypothetical protein
MTAEAVSLGSQNESVSIHLVGERLQHHWGNPTLPSGETNRRTYAEETLPPRCSLCHTLIKWQIFDPGFASTSESVILREIHP